ncbi:MAG TPA: AAA family ATPase [Ktedonobacteraceae bacterium]|nr:AAA family ATPase [Ktedonobacteraceae bacterium]
MITLKRLEANNFKSLRSVTLVFPKHGTVLIEGHNEAGKSTLFEAVYVALYGKPLVGEDKQAKQEEVIQHGQSQAIVQLTFNIGQQELTISRHFERGKSQQAKLVIQRPDAQPEEVNRVRAVDERILKELGNLDGDSLRNSCFVEQKELGRIEALSLAQREQAIQKLLGLERLTQLMGQFKFRGEQERGLILAQNYLKLAWLQSEARAASIEEAELAERLDAVKVAVQVKRLADLDQQKDAIEKRLEGCMDQVQEARDRLNRCSALKVFVSQSENVSHQLTDISHTRTELLRIAEDLKRLGTIEHVELPQARVYLKDVLTAAEAVTQTAQTKKKVETAAEAVREAHRHLKELEQIEIEQKQKVDELGYARTRVVQRREETEAEQQRLKQTLSELEATRLRIEEAFVPLKKWEAANEEFVALKQEISATEAKEQALLKLSMEMQRREDGVRSLEEAVSRAEKEMQQANDIARLATVYEAVNAWMRLKSVEMTLSGYTSQHTELSSRRQKAEMSLVTARAKTHMPFIAGIVLLALTVVALILGFLWPAAFALCAIFLCGAGASWLWYIHTRKGMRQYSVSLAGCTQELQRLDMQRLAAIQAGGDPVMLNQYEQQILASGLAMPSSLEAGRSLQEKLRQQQGTTQGIHASQEAAQSARDNHIRLLEQLRQACSALEGNKQELHLARQSDNPAEQLVQLKTQAAAQEKVVASDEETARQSLTGVAQWPTTGNALQTSLSECQIELRTTGEEQRRQEVASTKLIQEAESDKEKAEYSLQQARERVATLKASDPAAQLLKAQGNLAEMEKMRRQQEDATRPLLSKLHLRAETEVEPERGRAEARIQALENTLTTRPQRQEQYNTYKAALTNSLATTSALIGDLLAALNRLTIAGLPTLPQLLNDDDIFFRYEDGLTAALNGIRKALQATLNLLNEQDTRKKLEDALGDQGKIEHQKDIVENDRNRSQQVIEAIFLMRGISHPSMYGYESIIMHWPLIASVSPDEESQVVENLEEVRKRLYAARQQENQLATELHHPGTPLVVEECQQKVDELFEEREICGWATQLLRETHDRIARRVLPITERNMQPLLQQLTGGRYRDVRLTPEDTDGQPGELDYRIRVWDPAAGRYVAKNLFSGGTRDQCSLALRLAFALATLPQELGVAPGFIFLDEPLSAFDSLRAQALVELITTGTIAQQFNQVILISHQHAFDREAFHYHVRMESGRIVESDLPHSEDGLIEIISLESVGVGSE